MGSPGFADPAALRAEAARVYDICAGCRRCYNLCPSFTELLDVADAAHDGDASQLTPAEDRRVVDLCFNCNLCYPHCPYTPPHRWAVDFPELMLRAKVGRARGEGVGLRERLLGNPELLGRVGSMFPTITNRALGYAPLRRVMERLLGIDRRRLLPRYARRFSRWFHRQRPPAAAGRNGRVALFYTTPVEFNGLSTGQAAVEVLWRAGIDVSCPRQQCCGMPALDAGDVDAARRRARFNVAQLAGAVADGRDVVVPGPTCSRMLKREYPRLVPGETTDRVVARVFDLGEYLMRLHAQGHLDLGFRRGLGRVAYHAPCHLRVQEIGFKSRDLLRLVPDTTVEMIERCAGMDGTWGMKHEFYDESLRLGGAVVREAEGLAPDLVVSDCPLAGLQIEQLRGQPVVHPVEALAAAYAEPGRGAR